MIALVYVMPAYGTQLVLGTTAAATAGRTFTATIVQKAYSRETATLYVGLDHTQAGSKTATIWASTAPIGNETPAFAPITGTGAIKLLALATNLGNAMPYVAYTQLPTASGGPEYAVHTSNYNGTKEGITGGTTPVPLNDANGQETNNIVALTGMLLPESDHQGFIFAAVSPSSTSTIQPTPLPFGTPGSGIAVICLNDDPTLTSITLNQTAADSFAPTVPKAKSLDPNTPQVRINANPSIADFATMYWDCHLQRLYIGLQVTTTTGANNGAKSVVIGSVTGCGVLTFDNIVDEQALAEPPFGDGNAIVADLNLTSSSTSFIAAYHLRTMHCSTGPSYLIVNGSVLSPFEEGSQINNTVYALPLVDIDPESPIQGRIADKNASLSYKHTFTLTAMHKDELPLSTDASTQVGSGPLPIETTTQVSDIEVIGDTVFVSTATGQSALNDNGIMYSQALFDKSGKIVRWTPWAKRAFPFNAFCNASCINNGVAFFAVDAVTGKVWAVDGQTQEVVRVTAWDKGAPCTTQNPICPESDFPCCDPCNRCSCNCFQCQSPTIKTQICCNLPAQVCASLPCGCYSVLDLDQATRGFTGPAGTPVNLNRFALFGGCGKVDIARVSRAYNSIITSPQMVFEDFCTTCTDLNFLETFFPATDRNICINVLEYSRANSDNPDQCYFFAGTDKGLYTYALDGSHGFNLEDLTLETLAHGQWKAISAISDPIIDIKTTGLSLYIVTRSTQDGTMSSKVLRVGYKDTIQEMFADNNIFILAQTGTTPFKQAPAFTGIQPVTVATRNEVLAAEQLLLATNDGLFGSYAAVTSGATGIADAENQAEADWQQVPNRNHIWFEGIAGIDTPLPSTVWPISVEDICGALTDQNSWIYQISSIATSTSESTAFFNGFEPPFFNAIVRTPAFELIDPITYFWSDGARRFFIINRQQDPETRNKLMSFPFNTLQWRICAPGQQILLFDPYVVATQRFFWVKQIGITGILMAGTNDGVIALE